MSLKHICDHCYQELVDGYEERPSVVSQYGVLFCDRIDEAIRLSSAKRGTHAAVVLVPPRIGEGEE